MAATLTESFHTTTEDDTP